MFKEWKAKAIASLIEISKKYSSDKETLSKISDLIFRLHYLRKAGLPTFIKLAFQYSSSIPEVLEIIPSPQEAEQIIKETTKHPPLKEKYNPFNDAKKVAETILRENIKVVTGYVIARILNTSNSHRIYSVRELLHREGVLNVDKSVNFEKLKQFLHKFAAT